MRLSILGDDNPTTLDASVVDETMGNSVPDTGRDPGELEIPDDITDSVLPETAAEYLVLSPPSRSPWRQVLHGVGLVFLAAVLTTWPLTAGPDNRTEPVMVPSAVMPPWAPAQPQPATPMPSNANTGSSAGSINRPAAYAEFCRNSSTLCGSFSAPEPGFYAGGFR